MIIGMIKAHPTNGRMARQAPSWTSGTDYGRCWSHWLRLLDCIGVIASGGRSQGAAWTSGKC
jgi:hypothetical protein